VQAAITPLWPQVVPEAARDVLVACAQLAVTRGITASPGDVTAGAMLELTAEWAASGEPGPAAGFAPHVAYASSAAFDRDEDAGTLAAVSLLMAIAHPAAPARRADGEDDDEEYDERYSLAGYSDLDEADPDEVRGRWCDECGANSYYDCACDDGYGDDGE
jgi:hypothetical protein